MRIIMIGFILAAILSATSMVFAAEAEYEQSWTVFDAGGDVASSDDGTYTLAFTLGEPEGEPSGTGGEDGYVLHNDLQFLASVVEELRELFLPHVERE